MELLSAPAELILPFGGLYANVLSVRAVDPALGVHHGSGRFGQAGPLHLYRSARTNEPIIRALTYVLPEVGLAGIRDQFLLGDDLLVAPVLTRSVSSRETVLPPGRWKDASGAVHEGGSTLTLPITLDTLRIFRRVPAGVL
ncbi:hypothetical protein [Deinococcus sp. UYEF24]